MKRVFIFYILFFLFGATASSLAQDSTLTLWKKASHASVSFMYPPDWIFEKSDAPEKVILTIRPKQTKAYYPVFFEIILVNRQGNSFEDLKHEFMGAYTVRTDGEVKLLNKKDTTFSSLPALYATIDLYNNSDPKPIAAYVINGETKFYLITTARFTQQSSEASSLQQIINNMLSSVTFQ